MDCALAIFHRKGGSQFRYWEVRDIIRSPKQLIAMMNRGLVRRIVPHDGRGKTYQAASWQMTDVAITLMEVREGIR